MRSVAAVVALVACVHAGAWAIWQNQTSAPNVTGPLASVSYSPFEGHPEDGARPTTEQIRNDLKVLSPMTRAIRTYSATGGAELVPPVAAEFGLKVAVGAWLDHDRARNEREIRSVVDLYRKNRNINAIVVGNEAIYRADFQKKTEIVDGASVTRTLNEKEQVGELIRYIQQVKREVGGSVPVTTGEIYSTWLDHPELASAVDFIAVHILPYWEGFSATETVDLAINNYFKLRQAFPGKRIVIAEFGWPSAGYNRRAAEPGRVLQATLLRDFVARAEALGVDYNIIEAFDQPWKTFEGSVGAYWGLFDAARQPKFPWTGPIADPAFVSVAAVAVVAGLALSLPVLAMSGATLLQALVLALFANGVGAWVGVIFDYWTGHYFVVGQAIALGVGLLLMIPLVIIAMWKIDEIAQVLFGRGPQRLIRQGVKAPEGYAPKVSIHVPAYFEPPEMLKATLDAVARLDYPNYECVVIINNTPDPAFWRPIEEHCRTLGERFKFLNAEKIEGYKAGALRLALQHTAPDAEIIGIIDADYTVTPDWLKDLVPAFADPQVGLVQAPQDHRDGDKTPLHAIMNGEYAGFFDIGMVQRNEVDAIVTHGTMCLIRRAAMDDAGGWSSDTICEDTDLGLTIYEQGWRAHYTNRRYGHGLLPDTFEAFKKQRHRWAYGGFQIVKKHWRRFLPGETRLSSPQRREFVLGWMNWMGAESLGVVVAMLNLIWVPVVAFVGIAIPDKVLTLPILAASAVSMLHFATLYRARVGIGAGHATGAMLAAMAMQWTVAKAVGVGLIKDHLPFVRTAKGGFARKRVSFPAFDEAVFGGLLLIGAAIIFITNHESVREVNLFGIVLVVQSLPFLAAVGLAGLEGSRLNDFAFWRSLQARTAELLGGTAAEPRRAELRIEPPVSADKGIEPAQ
ncbi:glycosyltransferase [Rhodoplanes serenus]|uniref:Beta-monoglucosyldiacylglycerol synthase n=1 Tax=Rhodoplanes serenus TaxID=200615 RepID=A0A327K833_9BRAD|nr:glycosyltransferase [Rhodoplanes serenus]MTW16168.1 glycosyltransferase [Rhodoplanes serenus]RAI33933.1 glycosyl transferase family 2 [Rhodoplanes serenus]